MQANLLPDLLFDYPEFTLASLLAVLVLLIGSSDKYEVALPGWLREPARACLQHIPARYAHWLHRSLIHANKRSNLSFSILACWKVYPALLSLFLLIVQPLYIVLPAALLIWFIPDAVLASLVERRQREIRNT